LVLRWWADAVVLAVDGQVVHRGDLFDTACRWVLPERWWQGEPLDLGLDLRSTRHDDGALIESRLELEPLDPADPQGLLAGTALELAALRAAPGSNPGRRRRCRLPWRAAIPRVPKPPTSSASPCRPSPCLARGASMCSATPTWTWPGFGRWRTPGGRRSAPSRQCWI
jgi:hypothetical protein